MANSELELRGSTHPYAPPPSVALFVHPAYWLVIDSVLLPSVFLDRDNQSILIT